MDKPKRKKIYYIPGFISLTLLPLAFYFFAIREIQQSTVFAIPIFWADTTFMNKLDIVYSSFNGQFPPKRNYTDIVFTGDQQEDKTKLAFAKIRIREILKTGDTLNGLHFVFGDSSNYGTFVGALDKLRVERAKTYMPLESNLWFYHFQPDTTVKSLEYDCLLCNDVIYAEPEISWWTQTKETIIRIWTSSWQIIISYCCFLILVITLRRQNNGS